MSPNLAKQKALLPVLDRQYQEIRGIESDWRIFGREGDFRPRIEYFHDAVRALTSGDKATDKNSRLAVERLAWDVSMLRHIQAKPLHAGRSDQHFSPHTEVTTESNLPGGVRPDSAVRAELAKLYKDYTVLFVALLAETADMNAQVRTDEMNTLVEDCHTLSDLLDKLTKGKISLAEMLAAADHLENDKLREEVATHLHKHKPSAQELAQAASSIQNARAAFDKEIAAIDAAAMNFSTGQLAVYEDSRDTVKKLAAGGMNIAGKFVETAVAAVQRGGRGR